MPSILSTSTLMESQEFGEMMEHVDEVNFALDGLKKGELAVVVIYLRHRAAETAFADSGVISFVLLMSRCLGSYPSTPGTRYGIISRVPSETKQLLRGKTLAFQDHFT